MFPCPHCGKTIDVGPPAEVARCQYDPGNKTSLGCGTLIIIAFIVAIIVGTSSRRGADDIRNLRKDIQSIEQKIDRMQVKPDAVDQAAPGQRNQ